MAKKKVDFTADTRDAIVQVASGCAQDMEYEYASDAGVVAETALDANRLTIFGFPEADKEVHELVKKHGYLAVLRAAKKIVPTA